MADYSSDPSEDAQLASPDQRRAAMVAAIRGGMPQAPDMGEASQLQGAGLLFSLGQNPATQGFGQAALGAAQHQQQMQELAYQRALEAQRIANQQQYQEGMLGLQGKKAEDLNAYRGDKLKFLMDQLGLKADERGAIKDQAGNIIFYMKHGQPGERAAPIAPAPAAVGGSPAPFNPLAGMKPNQINEQLLKFQDALSDNNTRKLLGQNAQSLQRAEALERLLAVPDLSKITPQQVREAGTSLAGLISRGGSQALSQIEELVPQTNAAAFANLKQKFLNEPQGADAQAFLRNMLDTAAREKGLVLEQQKRIRQEAVPGYSYLRTGPYKTRWDSIMKGVGLNPDEFDENGLLAHPAPTTAPTTATHYLINKERTMRIQAGPDGKPLPGAKPEPIPPQVASNG